MVGFVATSGLQAVRLDAQPLHKP